MLMRNAIARRSSSDRKAERHAPSESLRLLGLCLAHGPGRPAPLPGRDVDWVGLAAVANAFLMAPALWRALEQQGLLSQVPDDFRDYLAAIYDANATRTEAMRAQLRRVLAALNACGIAPLLLKGAARLFETSPEAGCARMMADLDLLVEAPQREAALAALGRLGYEITDPPLGRRLHATTLRHPGEPAALDLHRDVGPQHDFIPLAAAVAAAVPSADGPWRWRLLAPTHRVMHAFFHAQIHDRGHAAGVVPLRALEDFAWIVARYGTAIDWLAIGRACDRLRLRRPWDAWAYLAERCLGTSVALPLRQPRRARLHYRRCLWQFDHRRAASALRFGLALTAPFSYATIDYKYGCGASWIGLLRARAIETLRLVGKYRHRIPQRLAAAIRDAQDQAF